MPVKKHAHFEIRNVVSRDALVAGAKAFLAAIGLAKVCSEVRALRPKSSDLCGGVWGGEWRKTRRVSLLQRAFRGSEAKVNFRRAATASLYGPL